MSRESGVIQGRPTGPRSISDLVAWLELAPAGTTLAASELLGVLSSIPSPRTGTNPPEVVAAPDPASVTWRERLWTVPAETRLGIAEVVEAIGRPKSFVYRHTSAKSGLSIIPHRKLDGELVFVAGELRTWLREQEEVIEPGHSDRGGLRLAAGGR